ncbi:MAG TPA: type I 3-dehydroquinate dehydratase [archaeon]|nr:type I 3-dehydroquinate dehydratase [archaeon]
MIIVPVVAKTVSEANDKIAHANKVADAIELRLDYFEKLGEHELMRMIKACEKPCVCTCRTIAEGGKFAGRENTAAQVLIGAIKAGAHFVDVEFEMKPLLRKKIMEFAKKHNAQVILSKHFTSRTPSKKELNALFIKMIKEKAHVIKIVTKATKHSDNGIVLELFKDAKKKKIRLIAFCMGEHGRDSRVLSKLLGAFAGFASLGKGFESAEGQIPIDEFRQMQSEMRSLF